MKCDMTILWGMEIGRLLGYFSSVFGAMTSEKSGNPGPRTIWLVLPLTIQTLTSSPAVARMADRTAL